MVIWLDIFSLFGILQVNVFYYEFEVWLFDYFSGDYVLLWVEWSKGWGYSFVVVWDELMVVDQLVVQLLCQGLVVDNDWDSVVCQLNEVDLYWLFSLLLFDWLML